MIIMRDSLTVITCHSCTDINAIGVSNPLYIKLSGSHFIRRDNTASYVLRVYYKEFELISNLVRYYLQCFFMLKCTWKRKTFLHSSD